MPFDLEVVSTELAGRNMLWLAETDSTMLDAARLAAVGCPHGSVVGADRQTAGQGRHGRSWHSDESGLYFTVILRLRLPAEHIPLVTLAAGLAVADTITAQTGLAVDLRWPNDIMIGNRKLCGILIQKEAEAILCGIGVNVNQESFPEEIRAIATSLRLASGREFSRERLMVEILGSLDRHVHILSSQGADAILRLFSRASSYVAGRRVVVEQGGVELRGTTDGLDENGFLYLRQDDGSRLLILAGGVRPA